MTQRSHHQRADLADGSHRRKDDCHNTPLKMRIQMWCKIDTETEGICQLLPFYYKLGTASLGVATWLHYMTCTEVRNPWRAVVRLKQGQWHIKLPGGECRFPAFQFLTRLIPKEAAILRGGQANEPSIHNYFVLVQPFLTKCNLAMDTFDERIRNMNKEGIPTVNTGGVCIANLRSKEPTAWLI